MIEDAVAIARQLYHLGYVAGREGNISIREGKWVYIKASGVYLAEATEKDFVKVSIDGEVCGERRPSIELQMHLAVYRRRDDVMALIHSHPPYTVALSLLNEKFEVITEEAKLYLKSGVGFIGSYEPGSAELANAVGEQVGMGFDAVILKGHGLLSAGSSVREAFERTVAVERCAMVNFLIGLARGKWQHKVY